MKNLRRFWPRWNRIWQWMPELTSDIRWTSFLFLASTLSFSIRSFSAWRAEASASLCLLNACSSLERKKHHEFHHSWIVWVRTIFQGITEVKKSTKVILLRALNFSPWASMVFSKSSCRLMSSSTWAIESPSFSSDRIGSREMIQLSSRLASRRNSCMETTMILSWDDYETTYSGVRWKHKPA